MRRSRAMGFCFVVSLLLISVLGNSICFHLIEGNRRGLNFGDALWMSVISITTIGYGDISAETVGGRIATFVFVVLLGLGAFSVFIGMGIDWVSEQTTKVARGLANIDASDHILIVNFPSEERVRQILNELNADAQYRGKDVVIVTDKIERLPFSQDNVHFVRGPVLEQETYKRACAAQAKMVIVLATSYSDSGSDAVVASAISVINSFGTHTHIVGECLNPNHRMLFDSVQCDAVVYSMQISGNLLAQEVHDPGMSQLIDTLTSNLKGTTLYSTLVTESGELDYQELAKRLLDLDINMVCVNRGDESLTSFRDVKPIKGDRIIYAGTKRLVWPELKKVVL